MILCKLCGLSREIFLVGVALSAADPCSNDNFYPLLVNRLYNKVRNFHNVINSTNHDARIV